MAEDAAEADELLGGEVDLELLNEDIIDNQILDHIRNSYNHQERDIKRAERQRKYTDYREAMRKQQSKQRLLKRKAKGLKILKSYYGEDLDSVLLDSHYVRRPNGLTMRQVAIQQHTTYLTVASLAAKFR
jgi:hypothetical protein